MDCRYSIVGTGITDNHSFARIADCLITPAKAQTRKTGFDRGVANLGYTASDIEGRQCLDWPGGRYPETTAHSHTETKACIRCRPVGGNIAVLCDSIRAVKVRA